MSRALLVAAWSLVAMPVVGCAALNSLAGPVAGRPIQLEAAEGLASGDLELKAYLAASTWNALQIEGRRIAAAPGTPAAIRGTIQSMDAKGTPAILALLQAAEAYGDALKAGGEAETHEAALQLTAALADAGVSVDRLSAAVAQALDVDPEGAFR
jgi:uncharacterized protein